MTVKVRFAPSPTGKLHVGNIRTTLFNWLYARHHGGMFILRLDDTDKARSTEAFAQGIRDDLNWLGLEWDEEFSQSQRFDRYDSVTKQLKESGRLYPCYENPDELDRKRKRQLAQGKPPIYDRAALKLTDEEKAAFEAEGRTAHWRFQLEPRDVVWQDLVRGDQHIDAASLSDPVLIRGDGSYLYTLPSVIDDIDMAITHVIRGEDHVANTGAQIQIFEALDGTPPVFAHHNLLVKGDGQALSKRFGALSVESLREEGLEPLAIISHAATIGTSDPVQPYDDRKKVAENFSFEKLSRAPARFDEDELRGLNAKLLHILSFEAVEDRLAAIDTQLDKAFWHAVQANLNVFDDVKKWQGVIYGEITPVIEDQAFTDQAATFLPEGELAPDSWKIWTAKVKEETGRKGKSLFHPLRLALTGHERGPELAQLLPLMGREKVLDRLKGKTA